MHKLLWILLFAYAVFCLFWTIRRAWKFYEKKVRPEWPFAWRLAFWVSAVVLGALAFVVSPILQFLWLWYRFAERPTILYYNKINGVTAVMRETVYNLQAETRNREVPNITLQVRDENELKTIAWLLEELPALPE